MKRLFLLSFLLLVLTSCQSYTPPSAGTYQFQITPQYFTRFNTATGDIEVLMNKKWINIEELTIIRNVDNGLMH